MPACSPAGPSLRKPGGLAHRRNGKNLTGVHESSVEDLAVIFWWADWGPEKGEGWLANACTAVSGNYSLTAKNCYSRKCQSQARDGSRPSISSESSRCPGLPGSWRVVPGVLAHPAQQTDTSLRAAHLKVTSRKGTQNLRKELKQLLKQRIKM